MLMEEAGFLVKFPGVTCLELVSPYGALALCYQTTWGKVSKQQQSSFEF
jgi:hypothetical protein